LGREYRIEDIWMATITEWQERVVTWAAGQPNIRAILLVGSYARRDPPPDEQSDLDLVLYTVDSTPYADDRWLSTLGVVMISVMERWDNGTPEHLVFFADGVKVDFAFPPFSELQDEVARGYVREVYLRGYHVLLDKDGLAAQLLPCPYTPPPVKPPSHADYHEAVIGFWFWALRTAQAINRNERWVAYYRDGKLKNYLLQMLEWHAQLRGQDTWHGGRFIQRWIDENTLTSLKHTFARFSVPDMWQALKHTLDLFATVSAEVGSEHAFVYPVDIIGDVGQRISELRQNAS
jgi:aminoglycoside 6-adenylyltransferase